MRRREFLTGMAATSAAAAQPQQRREAPKKPNILVVVSDTLRAPYLGPYGNREVQTPNLDRFATQAALFERNHPECLPTIPTRRTLHSGRRAYPFRNYTPVPWDNVYLPGWQPMDPEEESVAEALAGAGYHCGFVADVPHYFVPGMNFTRGFHQWDYVRGASEDRYRSTAPYDPKEIQRRYDSGRGPAHTANLGGFEPSEMDYATPRTFTSAMRFLDENQTNEKPFYLYVDTFHPHESWEAPRRYYDLYRDPAYTGRTHLTVPYSTLYTHPLPEADLRDIRAHYSGLVTMVDHWFGRLLDKLDETGMAEETYVFFVSDHGTNFGDNLEKVTGKPAAALYPGTMHIPLLVRHPGGAGAGKRFSELTYTLDVPSTVCAAAGAAPQQGVDGKNLLDLLEGREFSAREYLTCRYSNCVWYRDDANWYFSDVNWNNPRLFDMEAGDPFSRTIAREAAERVKLARSRILEDAGGVLPKYPLRGTDTVKAPFI